MARRQIPAAVLAGVALLAVPVSAFVASAEAVQRLARLLWLLVVRIVAVLPVVVALAGNPVVASVLLDCRCTLPPSSQKTFSICPEYYLYCHYHYSSLLTSTRNHARN